MRKSLFLLFLCAGCADVYTSTGPDEETTSEPLEDFESSSTGDPEEPGPSATTLIPPYEASSSGTSTTGEEPTSENTTKALESWCGDGVVDPGLGEECDDGNSDNTDECLNNCIFSFCGDQYLQDGEACDDGVNDGEYGNCGVDCTPRLEWCGDGILQEEHEACEAGVPTCSEEDACVGDLPCDSSCSLDFSTKNYAMYCYGSCSWAGNNGCDQEDADVFCKLTTGYDDAFAKTFETSKSLVLTGFACANPGATIINPNNLPMPGQPNDPRIPFEVDTSAWGLQLQEGREMMFINLTIFETHDLGSNPDSTIRYSDVLCCGYPGEDTECDL